MLPSIARLTLLLLGCAVLSTHANISCMDMNNNNVDWFIFYKIPKIKASSNAHIANGTGFMYLDSNNKQWILPSMGMETGDHAVYYTLQHYYQTDKSETFSVMYNDEFPNSTVWSDDSGHTKGVSVFSQQSGYWLIHSIPKFPSNLTYEYPSNAHTYGQMGICVSFAYSGLRDIATQLFYNQPFIYEMSVPPQFGSDFPMLKRVQQGLFNQYPPYTSTILMRSLGGQQFTSFAKCGTWDKDLYYDLVAPSLFTSLDVETWQHGNDSLNLHSWCSPDNSTEVLDISDITLPFGVYFDNYMDHSKFAVSFNPNPKQATLPWVCVGDINRQAHQLVRGGGTMCIRDSELWKVYATMVKKTLPCNSTHSTPTVYPMLVKPWLRSNRIDSID